MNKKKNTHEKGITLIALVITIIVMLILAAVTISLVVNGGLINYAGNASRDTQAQMDYEDLQMIVATELMNSRTIDFNKLKLAATGYTVKSENENEIVFTSGKGNDFRVTKNGTVTRVTANETPGGNEEEPEITPTQITFTVNHDSHGAHAETYNTLARNYMGRMG